MTENEVEEKFNSLQLAFKANQYTLQKRVTLQHRQRDLMEKNIETEIEGLLQALQVGLSRSVCLSVCVWLYISQ